MRADPTPYTRIAKLAADLVGWYGLEPETVLTWQVFGDRGAGADGAPVVVNDAKGKAVAQTFAATAADVAELAARHCREADRPNVYLTFGVHEPAGKRQQATCRRVLAVALDCDACDWLAANRPAEFADNAEAKAYLHALPGADLAELLDQHRADLVTALAGAGLPKPSSVWRSGYGHYALYALRADDDGAADVDLCRAINRDLVAALNGAAGYMLADKAATDAGTRVLRAPGAFNVKRPDRPLACEVLDGRGPFYTAAALRAAVPAPEPRQTAPEPRGDSPRPVDPEGRMTRQETALAALPFIPADDYDVWVKVGQALHALGCDLADWDAWSQSSAKYEPGTCPAKWHTFDGSDKPEVASGWLVNKARETEPDFVAPGWRAKQRGESPAPRRREAAATGQDAPPAAQEAPGTGTQLEFEGSDLETGQHRATTDIGNSERLVDAYGHKLRYCHDWHTWLVYDGKRWRRDDTGAATECAKSVAKSIVHEAMAANGDLHTKLLRWSAASQSKERVAAMLTLAQSHPLISVLSTQLDADPHVLNTQSGTVDLRTGQLRRHNQRDMITRITDAGYVADADLADTAGAGDWRRFLAAITNNDTDLEGYLRRAAGYSVTGTTEEEVLFFALGAARTGKTTFLQTIEDVLADYAGTADFEAFLKKQTGSDARPEIAKLQGRRFVKSSEVSKGRTFAEELIKTLTGGDKISARALHENPVEWKPQFHLWFAANDRPKIRHDDSGAWRRLRVLPFMHQMADPDDPNAAPEQKADKGLKDRLRTQSAEAVLAWLVRGCLEWREHGLGRVEAVTGATDDYRSAMDPLTGWMDEHCVRDDADAECHAATDDLYSDYVAWCSDNGERRPMSKREFGEQMTALLGPSKQTREKGGARRRHYYGIRLATDSDPDPYDDDDPKGVTGQNNEGMRVVTGGTEDSEKKAFGHSPIREPGSTRDTRDNPHSTVGLTRDKTGDTADATDSRSISPRLDETDEFDPFASEEPCRPVTPAPVVDPDDEGGEW